MKQCPVFVGAHATRWLKILCFLSYLFAIVLYSRIREAKKDISCIY